MSKPRDLQPPRPRLLTSRDKHENSFWMEQLPAHIWVQGADNSVIYSNRLSHNLFAPRGGGYCHAKRFSCYSAFMGEKKVCPCCPRQRIADTKQAERCICHKGGDTYHVYHFPFSYDGVQAHPASAYVLKVEVNVSALRVNDINKAGLAADGAGSAPGGDLVTLCSYCRQIRDVAGAWVPPERYFGGRCGIRFSHGLCPSCAGKLYPEIWPDNP